MSQCKSPTIKGAAESSLSNLLLLSGPDLGMRRDFEKIGDNV